jgi:hypothetical protein
VSLDSIASKRQSFTVNIEHLVQLHSRYPRACISSHWAHAALPSRRARSALTRVFILLIPPGRRLSRISHCSLLVMQRCASSNISHVNTTLMTVSRSVSGIQPSKALCCYLRELHRTPRRSSSVLDLHFRPWLVLPACVRAHCTRACTSSAADGDYCGARPADRLDVALCGTHRQDHLHPASRGRALCPARRRVEACARAHLLGSGVCARSGRTP